MSEALFVLNPRHIQRCIDAINSLDIPTCWLSYMTEAQVADEANRQVQATGYDRYLFLSDDGIPTQKALDSVVNTADQGHPVVTGYSNLDENDYRHLVNLTTNRLPPPPPEEDSYTLMTRAKAQRQKAPFHTTFAGLCLTCITRDLLLDHPLECSPNGGQLDYMLSYRLAEAGVPIVAAPKSLVHHVKENWNLNDENPEKQLLVGQRTPSVTWT